MNDCFTSQDNKKMKRSLEEEQRARKDLEKVVRRVLKSMNDPTWDETNLWGPCAPPPSEALKRERTSMCMWNTHNHTHNLRLVVWVREQEWMCKLVWDGCVCVCCERSVITAPLVKRQESLQRDAEQAWPSIPRWHSLNTKRDGEEITHLTLGVSITSASIISVQRGWKTSQEKSSPSVYNHLTVRCPVVHSWYFNGVNGQKGLGWVWTWTMPFHNLSYVI